ncbi:heavy metal translocating P-type ATPase [Bacillaceae bacterium W0354]
MENSKNKLLKKFSTHREVVFAILGGAFLLIAYLTESLENELLTAILYIAAYVIGGYYKAKEGLLDTIKNRSLNVEILMILAALGAASIGYWHEGAILIFIFSLSGALETYANQKSERDLSKLIQLAPDEANKLIDDQTIVTVPLDELNIGDKVLVRNGERVSVDGVIISGHSAIDESTITGESIPVDKQAGDDVFNGTINGSGSLVVKVTKRNKDSLFQKMIRLVEEAKGNRPPSQQIIEKIEGPYVITVLVVVGLMLLIPPLIGFDFEETFYRAMVLLVVASPCAVVASIMPAVLSAISTSARKGVLTKGGTYLEQLSKMNAIAFDKTGTITKGEPSVTDFYVIPEYDKEFVLNHLVAIENQSSHPLARAIVTFGLSKKTEHLDVDSTEDLTGFGVKATINSQDWYVGNEKLMNRMNQDALFSPELTEKKKKLQAEGKTVMFIGYNHVVVGVIAVKDQIRPEAKQLIDALNKKGIKTIMITGDNENTAQTISNEAGLKEWVSECFPEQKVKEIEKLKKKYGTVAMVGDGVNDAPAMAKADIGIAMGSGTDVAIETSDLVLMNSQLENISASFNLSEKLNRIIKQNLVFSIAVILSLIAANFLQSLTLTLGVIGHEGSTILVILNGLRLLKD